MLQSNSTWKRCIIQRHKKLLPNTTTSTKVLFRLQDHVVVCEAQVYQPLAVGKHKPLEVLQDKAVDVAFSKPFLQSMLHKSTACMHLTTCTSSCWHYNQAREEARKISNYRNSANCWTGPKLTNSEQFMKAKKFISLNSMLTVCGRLKHTN